MSTMSRNIPGIWPSHDLKHQERNWNSRQSGQLEVGERNRYQWGSLVMVSGASYTDAPPFGDWLGCQPPIFCCLPGSVQSREVLSLMRSLLVWHSHLRLSLLFNLCAFLMKYFLCWSTCHALRTATKTLAWIRKW